MKSARTKACEISKEVRERVGERDHWTCIICGQPGIPNAHYIPRGGRRGGLGIEQNIVTLCPICHIDYDNGAMRKAYGAMIKRYLQNYYGDEWDETKLIYRKYEYGI
jgi:hypothetical protein